MSRKFFASLAILACAASGSASADTITAWVIDAAAEKPYFDQLGEAFNSKFAESGTTLEVIAVPNYNDAIQSASVARDLPDVILLDGPNMAAAAWAGTIRPITNMIEADKLQDMMPGVLDQGIYGPDGEIYHVSAYDSTVILWGNRAMLEEAGVRIPTSIGDAWSREEMRDALEKLAKLEDVQWPLDMKLNYGGEWMTYGFAPFVQSNGGDLIDRRTWVADGMMNSDANVEAISEIQDWYRNGWIVPASAGDNQFYGEKHAALAWVGNWMWPPHTAGLGDDLVMIPAPNFGPFGVKSANGGWGWSVPSSTKNVADVKKFLNFVLSAEQVALYADITGFAPSRQAAVALSEKFKEPGPQDLFTAQGNCCAVVRPVHPAYPAITLAWSRAMLNILSDGLPDVREELDAAASFVDQDISENQSYPPFGS